MPRYDCIDDVLGPRHDRYFGDGYKRVEHRLSEPAAALDGSAQDAFRATASLAYPADWSTKKSATLVPHLSSVDTMALATAMCERVIAAQRSLDPDDIGRMWLRHLTVRTGSTPHLDLERIDVTAAVTESVATDDDELATTLRFQVGTIAGTLTMQHPAGATTDGEAPGEQDGHGTGKHFYLHGFKDQDLTISDIVVDEACDGIRASHRVEPSSDTPTYCGAESAYAGTMSALNGVIGCAQLAQVLLYELDAVNRSSTNNLWMTKFELHAEQPPRAIDDGFRGVAKLGRTRIAAVANGRWRRADVALSEFNGITGWCSLTHQLPDAV
jgi:Pseudomonas avirulence D protein (AvrD)